MHRISSIVIAVSVGVLLASLVVACLWPQPPVTTPPDDMGPDASTIQSSGTDGGQPTPAPPRPARFDALERGVVHATVEVETYHE